MTIYSSLLVSGNTITDAFEYTVNKTISENNSASSFEATVDNFAGRNGSKFTLGEEVLVSSVDQENFEKIEGHDVGLQSILSNQGNARGWYIVPKTDMQLVSLIKNAASTATTAYLGDAGNTEIANATIVGSVADISFTLLSGVGYRLKMGTNGFNTGGIAYSGAIFQDPIPVNSANILWSGATNGASLETSNASNIDSIVISGTNSNIIFRGILEDINYEGDDSLTETIRLGGRDYSARLMDKNIEPEVYTNYEIGSIVRDIMSKYVNDVSYSGVQTTSVVLPRISFNQTPVYDGIKQLAELAVDYIFYVDEYKDLKFQPRATVSTGYTLDSGNTITAKFDTQRDTIFNQIWVYGDRYLDAYKETITAGSPLGGSIFSLLYKPFNAQVTVSGAIIQPGQILGQTTTVSGAKFLVNFDDKQIIFISGTAEGMNIPTTGNSVVIDYYRQLPIVKVGDNEASKVKYGTRAKVIIDKNIKDPDTAQSILVQELVDNGEPKEEGNVVTRNVINVTPGNTIVANFPMQNIVSQTYNVLEARYEFSKENNLKDQILSLKLNNKINDFTDVFKKALLDIKKLQASDVSDSDLMTRFQYTTGSLSIRQSGIFIYTRGIGSSFILGHTNNGRLGEVQLGVQPWLGDFRGALTVAYSGGFLT